MILKTFNNFAPLSSLPVLRTTGFREFAKCPHTWAQKFLRPEVPEKRSVSSNIGTAAHSIVEAMMREMNNEENVEDVTHLWTKIPEKERDALADYITKLFEIPIKKVLGIEWEWRLSIDDVGIPLKGTIDLLAELEDGSLLIVDHKTNRTHEDVEYWKADIQPLMYAMAVRHYYPQYETVRYLLGYINIECKPVEWVTDPAEDTYVRARLRQYWRQMEEYEAIGIWPMRANDHCKYCPIHDACPERKAALTHFQHSITMKMSHISAGEKLKYVKTIQKLAEVEEAKLKTEIMEEIQNAQGGRVVHGDVEYSITEGQTRKLPAPKAMGVILKYIFDIDAISEDSGNDASHIINLLFTGKVGGLDEIAKRFPELGDSLKSAVEYEKNAPQLKSRALKPSEQAKPLSAAEVVEG